MKFNTGDKVLCTKGYEGHPAGSPYNLPRVPLIVVGGGYGYIYLQNYIHDSGVLVSYNPDCFELVETFDGWIPHKGYFCPVSDKTLVDWKLKNGFISSAACRADQLIWALDWKATRITFYRIAKPVPKEIPESPIREVTTKKVTPGEYGRLSITSDGFHSVQIKTIANNACWSAYDLRNAARVMDELADFLEKADKCLFSDGL